MDRAGEKHQTNADPAAGDNYEFCDFGSGRRLEQFGQILVDRPSPPAELLSPAAPSWPLHRVRFERETAQRGHWTLPPGTPGASTQDGTISPAATSPGEPSPAAIASGASPWTVQIAGLRFALRMTPSGQVGVFPEQAGNWNWLREHLSSPPSSPRCRVLNLFAYTGGSTLAAASVGAEVTHVDAADSVVKWARENLALAQMEQPAVRWIVDDVRKFVGREVRRARQYDALVLDPPSYGHGQRGEAWRLERDLPALLDLCRPLLATPPRLVLLTCHPPQWTPADLWDLVRRSLSHLPCSWSSGVLLLHDRTGRPFPSGLYLRGVPAAA